MGKIRLIPILCVLFSLVSPLWGHHFKGLPHFSYFENYPQIPQEEFLGQNESYEFSLVLYDFQGLKQQSLQTPNNAKLYLIIFNLEKNKVYSGPVNLEILDGEKPVVFIESVHPEEENVYSTQSILPPTGNYSLRVTLLEENNLKTKIPFLLTSQKIHWGKWIALSLLFLIVVAAVGSRRARILKDRKMDKQQARHNK